MIKFLVLSGDGINCENETSFAITQAGAAAKTIHVNELISKPSILNEYQAMAIPGGFSFGDHLGSGQVLALKLKNNASAEISEFAKKKPIIGICNGFQVLVRLGLLPEKNYNRQLSLVKNEGGSFIDKWVSLELNEKSNCIWTKTLHEKRQKTIQLPIRHGEGRLVAANVNIWKNLSENNQIVLRYSEDVNGSTDRAAGICDSSGLVFGLMPHPEAAIHQQQSPFQDPVHGFEFFKSAIQYVKESL